jgi:adenosine deaminase
MTLPHRLRADAWAWPFRSPRGLAGAHVNLDPRWLRPGFAAHAARHGPEARGEDVGQMTWGPDGDSAHAGGPTELFGYLDALSRRLLRVDGAVARLREDAAPDPRDRRPAAEPPLEPAEALLRWRFVSLQLPADLLLAPLHPVGGPPIPRVGLLPPLLRVEQPTAHLHAHHGQAADARAVWEGLPDRLLADDHRRMTLREGLREGLDLAPADARDDVRLTWTGLLTAARLVEELLAAHLPHGGPLDDCARCGTGVRADAALAILGLRAPRDHSRPSFEEGLRDALRGVTPDPCRPALLRDLLRAGALGDLRDPGPAARAAAQWLRVRVLLHQNLTMDPARPGLERFREDAEGPARRYTPRPRPEDARRHLGAQELRVHAQEWRSGVGDRPARKLESAHQARESAAEEIGWVALFSRSADRLREISDPAEWSRALLQRGVTVSLSAEALQTAVEAASARGDRPLRALRGVDLAGDERAGPLWLFRPALAKLREALDPIAAHDGDPGPGLTLHVGESFPHLLSGLRAVHEPVAWGLWRSGDRLGHALALGVDAEAWSRRHPRVPQRQLDRLLDLEWALDRVARRRLDLPGGLMTDLQRELKHLRHALQLPEVDLHAHLRALTRDALRALAQGFPPDPTWGRLVHGGLLRGGRWLEVPTGPDLPLLQALGPDLARELADRQVVIEVNPSSNLLVGALLSPLDQPRFWNRGLAPDAHQALPLCLSADDPLAFATDLEDEVAYAWAGMVGAGRLPGAFARGWIEDALRVAWRARFTANVPPPRPC